MKKETEKEINEVVDWCKIHKVSPCDFLLFALKRLIGFEAPQLEESVQHVFKMFLKDENVTDTMSAIEGLALKIKGNLSNVQYQKLRNNKVIGSQLPSLGQVIREKEKLDPGNVTFGFKTLY